MTEKKIAAFEKEGRGDGEGIGYKPWLTVHSLSSIGLSSRILGRHHRRIHHFLSTIEMNSFLEYDWRDDVIDIREQFPLDRGLTRMIAAATGIKHPCDPGTRVDIVMTTDLLVFFASGELKPIACKTSADLHEKRVLDKLEIERQYWAKLGRNLKIETERSFVSVRSDNLAYLHEFIDADDRHRQDARLWPSRSAAFLAMLKRADWTAPFTEFAETFDNLAGFGAGTAVATMRYLACHKKIDYNLDVKFDQSAPLGRSILGIASKVELKVAA